MAARAVTHPPIRRSRGAFTLIELLVVIGIIAVLVGILLPVLSSARKAANSVKCGAALKEIGNAFKLYSIDNRGSYPVAKWDILPTGNRPDVNGQTVTALYWQDFLVKYISKNQNINSSAVGAGNQNGFALARQSIFWGCPEWQGRFGGTKTADGISAYENGYSMNIYPTWQPTTPLGTYPPGSQQAVDSTSNGIRGLWPKLPQYRADRCLVVESNLWLLLTKGTDASHKVLPELNCSVSPGFSNFVDNAFFGAAGVGYNSIDRYRHGTYPPIKADGITYDDTNGGKVKFNILYGDGHVSQALSIAEGVRAIQMRDP